MKLYILFPMLLFLIFFKVKAQDNANYYFNVGDIEFNSSTDSPNFLLTEKK